MLAYELLVGKPPFEVKDEMETRKRIMYENTLTLPPHVSPEAVNFIKVSNAGRCSCQEIKQACGAECSWSHQQHLKRARPAGGSGKYCSHLYNRSPCAMHYFLQTALAKNAGMRPAAADLVHHAWLRPYLLAMAAASGQLDAATLRWGQRTPFAF